MKNRERSLTVRSSKKVRNSFLRFILPPAVGIVVFGIEQSFFRRLKQFWILTPTLTVMGTHVGKGLASVLIDFSAWSSIHGVPHIGLSKATWLRLLWVLIFCAALGMFIFQMVGIVQRYLAYPVNVDTSLFYGERVYPTVTVCNMNAYKLSTQASGGTLKPLIDAYNAQTANAQYGFDWPSDYGRKLRAFKWMNMLHAELMAEDETVANITYTYADLFVSCSYNTINCNESDWISFADPFYGRCFSFNADESKTSSRAGPLYGLTLVVRVTQAEYLPWTQSAGVGFYVHDADEHPFVYVTGYTAAVGSASSVGVRYVTKTKLPKPYSDCVDKRSGQKIYYDFEKYQQEACVRSCLQDQIVKECGCYDPTFPAPDATTPSCETNGDANANVDCIFKISNSDGVSGFDISHCQCPQPCTASTYQVTQSTAAWPAEKYTPPECVDKTGSSQFWTAGDKDGCKLWYSKNTAYMEIYYERMNSQKLQESEAYPFLSVISDTGGQVGLWLGMSVISVVEVLTLFLLMICYCLARPKDAYLPQFDEGEVARQRQWENKMRIKQEMLFGRKDAPDAKGEKPDLYSKEEGKDFALPPAVQDSCRALNAPN